MAASEMEVDLASHRIVRAAPGFLGLIFGPGPYKTMFGPIIHFIHPVRARRVFAEPRAGHRVSSPFRRAQNSPFLKMEGTVLEVGDHVIAIDNCLTLELSPADIVWHLKEAADRERVFTIVPYNDGAQFLLEAQALKARGDPRAPTCLVPPKTDRPPATLVRLPASVPPFTPPPGIEGAPPSGQCTFVGQTVLCAPPPPYEVLDLSQSTTISTSRDGPKRNVRVHRARARAAPAPRRLTVASPHPAKVGDPVANGRYRVVTQSKSMIITPPKGCKVFYCRAPRARRSLTFARARPPLAPLARRSASRSKSTCPAMLSSRFPCVISWSRSFRARARSRTSTRRRA